MDDSDRRSFLRNTARVGVLCGLAMLATRVVARRGDGRLQLNCPGAAACGSCRLAATCPVPGAERPAVRHGTDSPATAEANEAERGQDRTQH